MEVKKVMETEILETNKNKETTTTNPQARNAKNGSRQICSKTQ